MIMELYMKNGMVLLAIVSFKYSRKKIFKATSCCEILKPHLENGFVFPLLEIPIRSRWTESQDQ